MHWRTFLLLSLFSPSSAQGSAKGYHGTPKAVNTGLGKPLDEVLLAVFDGNKDGKATLKEVTHAMEKYEVNSHMKDGKVGCS